MTYLLSPGAVLDGYEIVGLLGKGGMGAVYRARRPGEGGGGLKTLMGEVGEEDAARFQREASLLAKLDHPSIVPIFGAGEAQGLLYFAMGLIEGESLEARIKRDGPLDPEDAVSLLLQIADGVAYAHGRRVIHRDLKPANVLLDREGRVLVTDFGLARQLGESQRLTRTGEIMGTPSFMAPEQAFGRTREVDERTDVYGLGAILYACLSGHPPFQSVSAFETLKLVREREPDPLGNPAVLPALEDFVFRAMAKRPEDRPKTAAAFAEELAKAASERPLPRSLILGLLALMVVCVAATGALVWRALEKKRAPGHATPTPAPSAAVASSRYTHLVEGIAATLSRSSTDKKVWLTSEDLRQLEEAFHNAHPSERVDLARTVVLLHERVAADGNARRFDELADHSLWPDDAARPVLARMWLKVAQASGEAASQIDPAKFQKMLEDRAIKTGAEVEERLGVRIAGLAPMGAAFARARRLDPEVPYFPSELEKCFARILWGAHVGTAGSALEDAWQKVFAGLDDHPFREYLRARHMLDEWGLEQFNSSRAQSDVRASLLGAFGVDVPAILRSQEPRGREDPWRKVEDVYKATVEAHRGDPRVEQAEAELRRLDAEIHVTAAKRWGEILKRVENATPRLAPPKSAAARELALMFLVEILRNLVWFDDAERFAAQVEACRRLVPDDLRDSAATFATAAIGFARGVHQQQHSDWPKVQHDWDEAVHAILEDVERHNGEIMKAVTAEAPAPHDR